jgi:predicted nucleic acid-binding protein
MNGRSFVDTNVLVYLFDGRTPSKRRRAAGLLSELARGESAPVVSTQVLQEAYVALTRKLDMAPDEALASLQMMEGSPFDIHPVDVPLIWRAAARSASDRLSFWGSLVVETAREAGCSVVYSEGLQAGRAFDGVRIHNPFD